MIQIEHVLNLVFLMTSELFQILIGGTIFKYFNGRRIRVSFILVSICIPVELAKFIV